MTTGYQQLLDRLHALIAGRRAERGVISTAYVGKLLLAEFPDCGISIDELENLVAQEAARGGVAVAIDGHPEPSQAVGTRVKVPANRRPYSASGTL
jgi:hypothetical protein